MNSYVALAVAILAEVVATSGLKATNGMQRPIPTVLVIIGYVVAFYFLSLTLKTVPVGIAYAIWSGLGIILVSMAGLLFYGQKLDLAATVGIGFILVGVMVINLFSNLSGH